ncbi:MAG TPA: serine hydrolase domain-containing protein [Thermoanaerobaculia bacterium]|jgi:CubicO group peptidase (beta-lactamase class C family)
MRRLLLLLVLLLSFAPESHARRRAATPPSAFLNVAAIDRIGLSALDSGIPGITIAIRKDNVSFTRAYGTTGVDTVYQIASLTKQFTAAATLRLAEQGKLRLDDRVRTWIPELDARFDTITVAHLLSHTSGLREYAEYVEDFYAPMSQQQLLTLIGRPPMLFAPGASFWYSNANYYLLGVILERASSKTYEQLLRDLFFEPLGLRDTSYCGTKGPVPEGFFVDARGIVAPERAVDMSLFYAAGALCSTAYDLVRWNTALVDGTAMTKESYTLMTTPAKTTFPQNVDYGFGLLMTTLDGRPMIWHDGQLPGFQTHLGWHPDDELTVAVLINTYHPSRDLATEIAAEIARALR